MGNPATSVHLLVATTVIVSLFRQAILDNRFQDRWISDANLVAALKSHFCIDTDAWNFTSAELNRALTKDKIREDGFLGEFERDLKVGDLQLLSYPADCPNELGPYWMTMPEREARRNNRTDPTKTEKTIRNKAKLSEALVAAGVEHPKSMKYRPMQKLAK